MKKSIKILLLFAFFLVAFVANIFISTGYFRTIDYYFEGEVVKKIDIPGAEDIMISPDRDFAIISATDRKKQRTEGKIEGGLYIMDLTSEDFNITPLTTLRNDFGPHGISMKKVDSTYKVMAINHSSKGHSIEVFTLTNKQLNHNETLTNELMISPNDLVMIDENRFYFTNDHKYTKGIGRLAEDYLGLALSNVIYFDGSTYREVASGIAYANGINYDVNRKLLFVASPRKFAIKVYNVLTNGDLEYIEDIDTGTGVDNVEFDSEGYIWSGCHPNLLQFSAYAAGKEEIAPSEIIKIDYKDKNNYIVETIYLEDGSTMSAASVAAPFKNYILAGNVMDDSFLILKLLPHQ